jgi:hypothetical protein
MVNRQSRVLLSQSYSWIEGRNRQRESFLITQPGSLFFTLLRFSLLSAPVVPYTARRRPLIQSWTSLRQFDKWSPTALQPWSVLCLRRNPPKRVFLRQGFEGHPLRIPPQLYSCGFLRRRVMVVLGPTQSSVRWHCYGFWRDCPRSLKKKRPG